MRISIISLAVVLFVTGGCSTSNTVGRSQATALSVTQTNVLKSIQRSFGNKLVPPSDLELHGVNREVYSDIVASFYIADTCLQDGRLMDAVAVYRRILKVYPKGHQASCAHDMLELLGYGPIRREAEPAHTGDVSIRAR